MIRSNDSNDVLKLVERIHPHTRQGKKSPHKAILLRLIVDRYQQVGSSIVSYHEICSPLKIAIREQSISKEVHPEYPFWFLQSDRLFEVISEHPLPLRKGGDCPSHLTLMRGAARGKLPFWIEQCLKQNPKLSIRIVEALEKRFTGKAVRASDFRDLQI